MNSIELERDARQYAELQLPKDWRIEPVIGDTCMFDALRYAFMNLGAKDWPWVGLVTDDLVCGTPGWDTIMLQSLNGQNVVSANPVVQAHRMHGAIMWSKELLAALGWDSPYPNGFRHWYGDDVWETLGRETGCWKIIENVITKHIHVFQTGVVDETANHVNSNAVADKARYEKWVTKEKEGDLARIRALQASKGTKFFTPDFKDVHLLIGSPAHDARYHDTFLVSLFQTMGLLQAHGGKCEWIQEKYNADISLARTRILDAFLRSPCTHLLMIDSDMGWGMDAVIRLFASKKDFVAVAGPKKSYPLRFAANHVDRTGAPLPLMIDVNAGCAEVTEIGAAFLLINRSVAERMVRAYPELEFNGLTHEPEHALFMPMVMNHAYKAEDFAFCLRWKAIGGQVYVVPDVPLTHSGQHTFAGALSDQDKNANPQHAQAGNILPTPQMQAAE